MLLPGETFARSYPAVPEAVGEARRALAAFARAAGADEDQLEAIRLVASEAVTNAVLHAYRDRDPGTVHLSASYVEDELWVLVADTGSGMQAQVDSPGLGLGLVLIAQLSDEFQILNRGTGGTELRLRFDLRHKRRRDDRRPPTDRTSRRGQSAGSDRERGSVSSAFLAA